MPHSLRVVLTTMPDTDAAVALARTLVEERLAACVNVLPAMRSLYRWEGAVHEDAERQLVIKTAEPQLPALEARLRALHPYDVPELLVLAADAAATYGAWLLGAVGPPPDAGA